MKLIYKKINKTIVVTLRSISMGVRFGSAGDRNHLQEIIRVQSRTNSKTRGVSRTNKKAQ